MRLFETGKGGLEEIQEIDFKLEGEIKRMVVDNFGLLFPGLELIASEFTIGNKRPDALAFDKRNKAFVILEYKKAKNSGVIDQAIVYHNRLNQNQNDCVMALMETRGDGKLVRPKAIDWQKTRLILVGSSFTKRQIEASDSEDRLELYEIHKYPNHLTVSRVGVADDKPRHKSPLPADIDKTSRFTRLTMDTSVILSVFKDGKTHTLREVYAAVDELYPHKKTDAGNIRHRVRARIRGLCVGGTMVRVANSTYRLA